MYQKIARYISVLSAPFVLSNKSGSCELDRAVTGLDDQQQWVKVFYDDALNESTY